MADYQVALYGLLIAVVMTVIQYFITSFLRKAEKFKETQISEIYTMVKELGNSIKEISDKIGSHTVQIEIIKEKITHLEKQVADLENKINKQ